MPDPVELRGELSEALALVGREAESYVARLGDEPVLSAAGDGAVRALMELIDLSARGATRSSGPRFFHFVIGGTTPAALGADWLTSALDQVAYSWASSPLASKVEKLSIEWLRELFELPEGF